MNGDKWSQKLLRLIAPVKCLGCGEITLESVPLCKSCMPKLAGLMREKCPVCGMERNDCACAGAKSAHFLFYYHSDFSKQVISSLKYHATAFKAEFISGLLYTKIPPDKEFDAVVYPPRSKKNKRRYDFDQSELIAKELSKKLGIPSLGAIKRVKGRKEQKLLSAEQRLKNVKGAYKVVTEELAGVKSVILLDDVMTTGATLNECSRLLKRAGVKKVFVLTVAKTPKSRRIAFKKTQKHTYFNR